MKKIVSIVLALVLVLAIAAPAMAITGVTTPVTVSAPFSGGISLIDSSAAGLGVLGLNAVATNKAYIANEVIYGRVDIKYNALTSWDKYDTNSTSLVLSSDAVTLLNAVAYKYTSSDLLLSTTTGGVAAVGDSVSANTVLNTITWAVPEYASYTVLFSGVVKGQGSIVAELKGGDKQYFATTKKAAITGVHSIYDDAGTLLYTFEKDSANTVTVTVYKADGKTVAGQVAFVRSGNECTAIYVNINGIGGGKVAYTVPISNEGVKLESIGDFNAITSADAFNKLKAVYEQVMNFFGFDYNAKGELLDAHFTCKLHSFYAKDSVTVNLYTQAITVPDPEVEIPQTGDAATTIGFVMVAMAIVAAAAVAYKKVRA